MSNFFCDSMLHGYRCGDMAIFKNLGHECSYIEITFSPLTERHSVYIEIFEIRPFLFQFNFKLMDERVKP